MNEDSALTRFEQMVEEGRARIIIPKMDMYVRPDGRIEPAWMPVFYNPSARVSRDLTILVLESIYGSRDILFIDPLAGTGIRGIRIALEKGGSGIVNDVDPRAAYYIRRNIRVNGLEGRLEVYMQEANVLLNNLTFTGLAFDYIDLDPYGSPTPFIDSVFKPLAKEAVVGITATDTAPLVCSHYRKTLRRYWFTCVNTDFEKELGARILLAYIAMRAAALDISVEPLLVFLHRHYYRVFLKTRRSSEAAYNIMRDCLGYIWYCPSTLERGYLRSLEEAREVTCLNGEKPVVLGKLWICRLGDKELVEDLFTRASGNSHISGETLRLLRLLREEIALNNPYIRVDKLCSILKRNMPKYDELISMLRSIGINASRTHFDPRGLKIESDTKTLIEALGKPGKDAQGY